MVKFELNIDSHTKSSLNERNNDKIKETNENGNSNLKLEKKYFKTIHLEINPHHNHYFQINLLKFKSKLDKPQIRLTN